MSFDIESIKRKMLVKYPFFGSIVANVKYNENRTIKTAGTDGEVIHYNPDFLEKLSIEEQIFIFAHEVCHIAFNHILRSEGKDHEIWNIATDAVINAFLKKDGLKMAKGGVDIADAINYDAEQLYEKLLQEKKEKQSKQQNSKGNQSQSQGNQNSSGEQKQQSNNQNGENSTQDNKNNETKEQNTSGNSTQSSEEDKENNEDVGHDTHSLWEDAIKKHKEEQNNSSKKENLLDRLFNKNKPKQEQEKEKSELEKKQEEISQLGEKQAFNKNKEEKKKS